MSALDGLRGCAGRWRGTNRLHDPNTGSPADSPSTVLVTPLLGGKFVRLDYTWSYGDRPQEGVLIVGHEVAEDVATAYWIDMWHMGDKGMACRGTAGATGEISVRGAYAAPPGPDWRWRTVIAPADGDRLRIVMFNISPDGTEELAVEADHVRA